MSIISEALRRAHLEAVRQDRVQARLYRVPGAVDYPLRASRRRLTFALLATNAALLGAVGVMLWVRRDAARPAVAVPRVVRPTAPAAVKPIETKPATAAPAEAAPAVPVKRESRRAVATAPSPSAAADDRDGLVGGRTYAGRLSTTRGEELVLSGLTAMGDRSAALINGKVVWEGERIGSFLVKHVTRERVELQYRDLTVYLWLP